MGHRATAPRTLVVIASVALLLTACGTGDVAGIAESSSTVSAPTTTSSPVSDGWRAIPDAPIGTRPYAVSGWTGSEAVFWAGSNLLRNFANTRGAAFNPATEEWRELPVPGWGHPGLTGAVVGNEIFAAAKGGGTRIDITTGLDTALPENPGFNLANLVATDEAVWGLGPVNYSEEPVRIGIARYDSVDDAWIPGPAFEGAAQLGSIYDDILFVEHPALWTGSEIVIWAHGYGLAFDPASESWTLWDPLVPDAKLIDSRVTVADVGLVTLAWWEDEDSSGYRVAYRDGNVWVWHDTELDLVDFETTSIAGAGDWIMVFSPDHRPQTVEVNTGTTVRHSDAPMGGIQAPNVVWTGEELVIWAGVVTRTDDNPNPVTGAVWVPPAGG